MKKIILNSLVAVSLALTLSYQAQADTLLGAEPTLKDVVKISTLLEHPEKYLDKEIKVEGIAMDVCPMRGCWMKIKSDQKKESLLIKVNDGEMVFPMSARGKNIILQGKLLKKTMPIKEVIEIEQERAKKEGKPFDPKSIKEPRTMYSFKPTGVIIKDKK